jgi:phosphoribosylanthranilate isomerase
VSEGNRNGNRRSRFRLGAAESCSWNLGVIDLRIKICGITNEADASQAALLGADAVGLNFYARSPRCIPQSTAVSILRELPPFVEAVGLFVNLPQPEVLETLEPLGRIRTFQWYGEQHEPADPFPYQRIAAFSICDQQDLEAIMVYLARCRDGGFVPAAVLTDAHVPGQYGGTGRTPPWELLGDFRPGVPLILAGGLTPENVAEAVRMVRPYAVDVASGVEQSPRRKDPEKMRRFVGNAREAAAKL